MNVATILVPMAVGVLGGILLASMAEPSHNDALMTAQNLIEGGSPIRGDSNAPVTILEWGDYQCSFCAEFHSDTLTTLSDEYIREGKANMVFRDFPLNGPDSVLAAQSTHCAGDQDMYWQYHDILFESWAGERTGWITRDALDVMASTLEMDLEEFNSCIDDEKYRERVDTAYAFGQMIGIDATPTFLIFNSEEVIIIRGNQPAETFKSAIEGL